jgi:RTX toxins and related Ca2+-binding proteins
VILSTRLGDQPFYSTLWDAGGVDEILVTSNEGSVVDMRSASLQYEAGGGGYVSYANGVVGGFTIASGAIIENASGGSGDDVMTGNEFSNVISGGLGADIIYGGSGADRLSGGGGDDELSGGNDADTFIIYAGDGQDRIIDFEMGIDILNFYTLDGDEISLSRINTSRSEDGSRLYTIDETASVELTGVYNFSPEGHVRIAEYESGLSLISSDMSALSDADGLGEFSFQWFRDDAEISGATSESYQLIIDDTGSEVWFNVDIH